MDLKDKICLITGGASGIGLAMAKAIIARGGTAILADIDEAGAQEQAAALGDAACAEKLDVRNLDDFTALAKRVYATYGRVDVLVNNAGVGSGGAKVIDAKPELVDWLIDINLKGVWRGISVFGKLMREQKTPSLICIMGSENSLGFVFERLGVYAATKHGLLGMADVLRHELPDHMGVCIAFPGAVRTNLLRSSSRTSPLGPPPDSAIAFSERLNAHSMTAEYAGELIVRGLEREDFIIPVHPHVLDIATRRQQELEDSFARHAPPLEEVGDMHITTLIRKAMEEGE